MSSGPAYLHAIVATAASPTEASRYKVFSLRIESPNVPLSQLRIHAATKLGIDPNSWMADALMLYRIDETLLEDDTRLLQGEKDPTTLFRLTDVPDSLQNVGRWFPDVTNEANVTNALHLLVQLPPAMDAGSSSAAGPSLASLSALPPAYSSLADAAPIPASAQDSKAAYVDAPERRQPLPTDQKNGAETAGYSSAQPPLQVTTTLLSNAAPATAMACVAGAQQPDAGAPYRAPTASSAFSYDDYVRHSFQHSGNLAMDNPTPAPKIHTPKPTSYTIAEPEICPQGRDEAKGMMRRRLIWGLLVGLVLLVAVIAVVVVMVNKSKGSSSSSENVDGSKNPTSSVGPSPTSGTSPTAIPSPAPKTWLSLAGYDYYDYDLPSFRTNSLPGRPTGSIQECGKFCEADAKCKGAIWLPLSNTCYGKSELVRQGLSGSNTIYIIFPQRKEVFDKFTYLPGQSHPNDEIVCYANTDPLTCGSLCVAVALCQAIDISVPDKRCCLRSVPVNNVANATMNMWTKP
ncbi:hypothetical protein DFJ77DRAFT_118953 [Powellomyces hirtus]|nr:hypothetical protein DFJ77DRAFT_118953 [Powellomyces hirtus]